MEEVGDIIVLDVGKTLSKLSRWSSNGVMRTKMTRPNAQRMQNGVAVLDVAGIGAWVREKLPIIAKVGRIASIITVGHGAGVAAIRGDQLAFTPLDYEQDIPADVLADYRRARGSFAETGSPALPCGLNMGAQLHWLEGDGASTATLLPWAQYWAWFLSGVVTSEVTSLGCHSDLWNPVLGDYSALAKRRGWAAQFAPIVPAGDVIGTLKPEFGLGISVKVHCGVHDSNAALIAARGFAEIEGREATILSTGTWFIAMRSTTEGGVRASAFDEARDCLINVDAYGAATPSARFMGGREVEELGDRIDLADDQAAMLEALPAVLANAHMIVPSFAPDCGPFPAHRGAWIKRPEDVSARRAVIALYLALLADTSVDLIGATDRLLIEGRFAGAELFVRALATLRPDMVVYTSRAEADVSFGALRLIDPSIKPAGTLARTAPLLHSLDQYKAEWHRRIEGSTQ